MIYFVLIGIVAGLLAGLFGVGGGIIIIPSLIFTFPHVGINPPHLMQTIAATTFASMLIVTGSSAWAYFQHRKINVQLWLRSLPGILIGTAVGAHIAVFVSSYILQKAFAVLLCILATHLWFWHTDVEEPSFHISNLRIGIVTFLIGILAGLFGLGGGILLVPFYTYHKVPLTNAIGTSAACTFFASITGTLSFLWLQYSQQPHVNYINWPAALLIGLGALIFVRVGVKLALLLKPHRLRQCFVVFLLATSLKLGY